MRAAKKRPVPTADQSPCQGNKGISLHRHDSSNCLPVSTHPDVRLNDSSTNPRKTPRSSSRNPGQIRFRGFAPHFSAADRPRVCTSIYSRAGTRAVLVNPVQSSTFFAVHVKIPANQRAGTFSSDGCEPWLGWRFGTRPRPDRLGPRGFGGVWCEFGRQHALGDWRTTPHAAPDANAPEPHLPVRNECRSPYAGLAPSERSIERARRRNRVHTGRSSSSGKS